MSGSPVVALVDDDLAAPDSLRFLLEASGHSVAAYNSAAAFLADRDTAPACLIVDQYMPCMTGLELIARLRQQAASVPALMVTSMPSAALVTRAGQLGVPVLEKPPAEADLLSFIDGHV